MIYVIDDTYANREPRVYDKASPTLRATRSGLKVFICAMRGRNSENPNDRTRKKEGSIWIQRLEPNTQGISNTITTVPKDNMVVEKSEDDYVVRNLTPREYWRLMSYSDEDFDAASSVTNQTNLYKQAGNGICKDVLIEIFRQLF